MDLDIKENGFIVIKDENRLVDLSQLKTIGGDSMNRYRKLVELLKMT